MNKNRLLDYKNLSANNLKDILLLCKYRNLENIKKMCNIVGMSSILTCFSFYVGLIFHTNQKPNFAVSNFLIFTILTHLYINGVFIYGSLPYDGAKGILGGGLSLIFISPTGIVLIAIQGNKKYGENTKLKEKNSSIFHSLTNSLIDLKKEIDESIKYLHNNYPNEIKELFDSKNLSLNNINSGKNKDKFFIIALHEILRQTKKKNTFKDITFHAHGYDNKRFDFAIQDPKNKLMPTKYKYSLAMIVLDEFNNYQKILTAKKEIKTNMKFGPSKAICLHGGKGFKVYVNE